MSVIKKICVMLISVIVFSHSYAGDNIKIRLAIIDNFHFQKNIVNHFESYYKPGIELAKHRAQEMGYEIIVEYFDYSRLPLGVLEAIPMVKKWNPDIIIGPRNSNVFLLLNGHFENVLVLSPFATSDEVASLPKNFYSLAFPDLVFSKSIFSYLNKHYPTKKVFGIIEADCKNCIDLSNGFKKEYNKDHPNSPIKYEYFSGQNNDEIDVNQLMKNYRNEDIIFIPNNSAVSAILIPKIINHLNRSLIFVGGDDWGSWNNTEVGKFYANHSYHALRFTPLSFDIKTPKTNDFMTHYLDYYKKPPEDVAAYLSYNTVMSFLVALNQYKNDAEKATSTKEMILESYLFALEKDKNWFRENSYFVYDISPSGSHFLESCQVVI